MSNIKCISFIPNEEEPSDFSNMLIAGLLESFKCNEVSQLPDNYGDKFEWSLLNLIRNKKLDIYTILYVDDIFWSGSGGKIIEDNVYQGAIRTFTNSSFKNLGLTKPAYNLNYAVVEQVKRAKKLNSPKIILSFNNYNVKLFKVMQKFLLNTTVNKVDPLLFGFKPLPNMVIINNTPQWVLEMKL